MLINSAFVGKSVVLGTLLAMLGCGGGGGGGSATGTQPPATPIGVNTNNAPLVAADAFGAIDATVGAGDVGGALVTAVLVNANPGHFRLANFARTQLVRLSSMDGQLVNSGAIGAVITVTVTCDAGSVTMNWNDADNNSQFSSGDTFSLTFNSCFDAASSTTVNGGMQISNYALTGDPTIPATPWNMSASFSFTNLGGRTVSRAATINGGFSFALGTVDGITLTGSVSGTSLLLSDGSDNGQLSNFALNYTEDTNTLAYTISGQGKVSSTALGGSVTFNIQIPFQGTNIDLNFPDSGAMRMTGTNNSSVVLNAMGGDNVRLDIDADGDGIAETTVATTWTALQQA